MYPRILLGVAIVFHTTNAANGEARVAVARLLSANVTGTISFTETEGGVRVSGVITGLASGKYGFHIHELGDVTTCDTTGAHFEPDGASHGGRQHAVRHVGDLGNVEFTGSGAPVANVHFVDRLIALRGRHSVLGRALVLHAGADDLGLGGDELSLVTGNSGPRIACGVIGIKSPGEPWNSAAFALPSMVLLVCGVFSFVVLS